METASSSPPQLVTASAPGKVILMGEHAAVYGRPAVVAAVGLRLTVRLRDLGAGDTLRLDLADLGVRLETTWEEVLAYGDLARRSWYSYAASPSPALFRELRGSDPAHLVKVALGEALSAAGRPLPPGRSLELAVASQLPTGSGFGSSAALTAALLTATCRWLGCKVPDRRLAEAALEAERRQHGLPSGVDTATVLAGGILWVRREGGELATEPVPAHAGHLERFALFDSGRPAEETGTVVAEVQALRDRDPRRFEDLLDGLTAQTEAFRRALTGADTTAHLTASLRRFAAGLEGLGVVPEPVRRRIRAVEAAGGAAKVCGAGSVAGPGAGSLLVYHPEPERLAVEPFLSDLRRFRVPFGDAGTRIEPPAPEP